MNKFAGDPKYLGRYFGPVAAVGGYDAPGHDMLNPNGDPRGPLRRVSAVEHRSDATLVTCECGHVNNWAPHCGGNTKLGERVHCYHCGPLAKR